MATEIYEAAKVLRERADDSLRSELVSLQEKLWRARFDLKRGHLSDTALLERIKRQIARLQTVQSERRLEAGRKASAKAKAKPSTKTARAAKSAAKSTA